jgi:LCP family protein required for cell wall assembly
LEGLQYDLRTVVASLPPWRAFVRRYVIALVVTFVLVTGGLIVGNRVVDNKLNDIPRVGNLTLAPGPGKAGNYLILGSDSRSFETNATQQKAFGSADELGKPRSDTLMIVHIDPDAKTSLLVSFPRDLLVKNASGNTEMINAAFNDGPQAVIDTIKRNFDIDINHYVEINFEAFIGIVDAVGKIPVYFPYPARDKESGLNIPTAGCISLNGDQALAYARSRTLQYYDANQGEWIDASPRADLDRITRQQAFIRRLADVAARKSASNPLTALDVADSIVPKLHVDTQLSKQDIFQLVNTFRKVNPNDSNAIQMQTIPVKAASSESGRLVLQQPQADSMLAQLRTFGATNTPDFTDLHPAQVQLKVLNASGVGGAAGTALADFQRYGFQPAGVGNTSLLGATQIHYRPGDDARALLVASYMKGVGQIVADSSISGDQVVVMVASDFKGVAPSGKHKKAPATTTTTAKSSKQSTTTSTAPGAAGC